MDTISVSTRANIGISGYAVHMDIAAFLETLGLGRHASAFAENDVDETVLAHLTDTDLKELGIASLGHRKRLLAAIAARRPAAVPPSPSRAPPGERRQVTVLFADLSGFTALSKSLDPEELHDLVTRYTKLVDGIVVDYGGTVDKHIGDAVMALFGAPRAHDDDPVRAARAALDIHAALARLSDSLGRSLQAHIGIASGEVVAGTVARADAHDYTALGDSVNLAARLVGIAVPGQTLISESVHHALSRRAVCEPQGEMRFKGIEEPVRVWRLREMSDEATPGNRSPFVGREAELDQLKGILGACLRRRAGQIVYVRGEAGIGKTRFVGEMSRMAEGQGFAIHRALVLDFGVGRGQDPIRALLRGLIGLPASADAEHRRAAADDTVVADVLSPDQRVFLDDLLDIPQSLEGRALYDAMDNAARMRGKRAVVVALVAHRCRSSPAMIVVEDLHWADPQTLTYLAAVAAAVAEVPGFLVMTSRVEGDPLDAAWRASCRGAPFATIDLGPLHEDEALSLAGGYLDATQRVALACIERAGGNPLFLEQLLRNAEEGGEGSIPASIQSLVLARLDRLEPLDRRALQAASIIGQRFELGLLRRLIADPEYSCEGLVRNALVLPEGDGFLFAHALIQEGAYQSLLRTHRRELHRLAADWFADQDVVLRAQHLDRAGVAEAARAYLDAAKAQAKLFRHDQAIALASRGLALAIEPRDAFELAMLVGDLQQDAGRGTEALHAYERASTDAGDDAGRCRSLIGRAASNRLTARLDKAFSDLAEAEPLADKNKDDRSLAEIHYLRGNLHFARGQLAECRSEHEAALLAANRLGSSEWQARALSGLADAQYMDCRMATALRYFGDCVDLCEAQGLTRIAIPNRVMMGHCRIYTCAFDDGLNDMRAAMATAAKVGNRHAEMFAAHSIGFCLTAAGRYAEASNVQLAALEQARALKAQRYQAIILGHCAEVALSEGQRQEALGLVREAREISEETGPGFIGPILYGLLALLDDRPEDQEAALNAGEVLLERGSVGHNHFWFRRYAIERALLLGNWDEVAKQADALLLRMADEPLPYATYVAERGRLLARHGRGEFTQTDEEKLRKLLTSTSEIGMRIDALGEALRGN